MTAEPTKTLHATAVSVAGRGLLLLGPSGSGKSATAIGLIALGADLIADDLVCLTVRDGHLIAHAPKGALAGIEARGIGLVRCPLCDPAPVTLAVDLGRTEADRLPPRRSLTELGRVVPLQLAVQGSHLAPSLFLLLQNGRLSP